MNLLKLQQQVATMPQSVKAAEYQKNTEAGKGSKPDLNLPTVTQEQADLRDKEESTLGEVLPAAFRENNITANVATYLNTRHVLDDSYDRDKSIAELSKDIPEEYHGEFSGESRVSDEQALERIKIKMRDKDVLQKSHGFTYWGATGLSMLADPIGIGLFAGEAKLLKGVLTKGARAKNALWHGVSSAGTMEAYTYALKEVRNESMDESDVLWSALGGFGAGFVGGTLSKGGAEMNKALRSTAKEAQAAMDAELIAGVKQTAMTREEALARAADEPLPEFTAVSRPKEAAKSEVLRKDIADMQAARAEDQAAVAAAHGAPGSKGRAADPGAKLAEADQYTPLIEAAQEKLTALETRLGDTSAQQAAHISKRADELLAQNAKLVAKPVAPAKPVVNLDANDKSLGMFKQARESIAAAWDQAAKNDGSTLGMFNIIGDGTANKVERVATEAATLDSQLAEHAVAQGSAAAVRFSARAAQLRISGAFDGLKAGIGKLQTRFGKFSTSDSSFMLSSNSDEAKLFMHDLMSNGTGVMDNAGNAAIKKSVNEVRLLSEAQPEFVNFGRDWRKANGKQGWHHSFVPDWVDDMYKELRTEMELRTNAHNSGIEHVSPHGEYTQKMADALDRANGMAVDLMKSSGVHLADEIVKRSGYVTLLWNGRAINALYKVEGLYAAFEKRMAESYVETTGMPLKDAQKVAKAVFLRAKNNDLGIDSNPHALLSRDSREFLRETLKNSESMTDEEMNSLFSRIDASMSDSGASARVKRRTNIDLLAGFEHEGKQYNLLDLVDNDMQMMHRRYIGEVSGRSAMAAKEIATEADWTAMRSTILEAASRAGDSPATIAHMKDVIAATHDQLLSRPALGGVNRNARRIMDWTGISLLAQAGLPQIAELAQIQGSHGLAQMWKILPVLKEFRTAVKNGTVSKDIISDIMPWTGRIHEEHLLYTQNVHLDDKLGSDAPWIRRLDRVSANMKELSGRVSGMYALKSYEQKMTVALQADKMAHYLKGITFTADGYKATGKFAGQEARLKAVGWDTEFFRKMKSVEKHFEWDGDTIQRINMQKWNDPLLINQFVEGIHIHANQIIQRPLVGETHVWMHTTLGSMLTQFRNYPLVGIEKQSMRHMHMNDEESYFTAMYALGMSSLVSTAKAYANAQGKSEKDRKAYLDKKLSPSGLFKGALAYASPFSMTQDGINVLGGLGLAPANMVSTQTSRSGGTRGVDISFKDIPALGFATNGVNAVGGLIRNTVDPSYKYGKQDTRAARGIFPLGTMLGINNFLNVMDEAVRED